jgi:hypothetical protein
MLQHLNKLCAERIFGRLQGFLQLLCAPSSLFCCKSPAMSARSGGGVLDTRIAGETVSADMLMRLLISFGQNSQT